MRARSQEGEFQVISNIIPLSPVSEVCGVPSTRTLSSNSGRQPRAILTGYTVWGDSWTPLTTS